MDDIDIILWRPLLPGKEFEGLLPKVTCQKTFVGDGLTDFTIKQMGIVAPEYAFQTTKLAAKLRKDSLQSTLEEIHWFLFNHLQYHADMEDQMLRTPACSWYTRNEGIDCKSYSIFASCLLLNLKLKHYIRRIKQPGKTQNHFTHVYVVIPKNQESGNLEDGYFTIDGTLPITQEPQFLVKDDLNMKHYVLNGANQQKNRAFEPYHGQIHYRDGYSYQDLAPGLGLPGINIKNIMRKFSFKSITSIFGRISCLGGSGFTSAELKAHLEVVSTYYTGLIIRINEAVQQNNYVNFAKALNEYYATTKMFVAALELKQKGSWNSCTSANIATSLKAFKFYRDVTKPLLEAWVQKYFVKTGSNGSITYDNWGAEGKYGMQYVDTTPNQIVTEPLVTYVPNLQLNIPMFEITKYVEDQTNSGQGITITDFFTSLQNFVQTATPSSTNNNPSNPNGSGTKDDTYVVADPTDPTKDTPKTPKDGMSTTAVVMTTVGILSAVGAGIYYFKNKS